MIKLTQNMRKNSNKYKFMLILYIPPNECPGLFWAFIRKEKSWRWNCQNCMLWTGSGGVGEGREKCTLIIERSKTNHFDNCPWKLNDIKLLVEMKLISDILKEICVIFLFEGISRPVGLDVLWVRVFSFRYVLVC